MPTGKKCWWIICRTPELPTAAVVQVGTMWTDSAEDALETFYATAVEPGQRKLLPGNYLALPASYDMFRHIFPME